jgi:hypothetical protein
VKNLKSNDIKDINDIKDRVVNAVIMVANVVCVVCNLGFSHSISYFLLERSFNKSGRT